MQPFYSAPNVDLYQGDAIATLKALSTPVDFCVTSPQYFQKFDYQLDGQYGLEASLDEYLQTQVSVFHEIYRLMPNGGTAFIVLGDTQNNYSPVRSKGQRKGGNGDWHSRRKLAPGYYEKEPLCVPQKLAEALRLDGWRHRATLIWDKGGGSVVANSDTAPECHEYILQMVKWSGKGRMYSNAKALSSSVLRFRPSSHPQHGCTYPLALAQYLVEASPDGCTVLDPYVGSGTTALAAKSLGRKAIGIDLDCRWAVDRCSQLSLLEVVA
ncbi:hypothetical protein AVDCRST_MAG94-4983 [uncultured Leptolyngbya sp.]|uniref:Methyltransferase n=1 Tax=uncultured Leptolyngbya sp. TaxID=332963 RepID=A0A6J4NAF4_9CYAN|nr:hypothetical protein AVDCRST_MAG94-4983 [uncultured Leptolyngbya sp.]